MEEKVKGNGFTRSILFMDYPGERGVNYIDYTRNIIGEYKKFFKSDIGGCWEDGEFIDMHDEYGYFENTNNPQGCLESKLKILNGCDYSIVVFVGHGCYHNHMDKIQLSQDVLFSVNDLYKNAGKRLVIVDSCRSLLTQEYIPSFTKIIRESKEYDYRNENKKYYNRIISDMQDHIELIQSTQICQYAATIHIEKTSVFSKAFFNVINQKKDIARSIQLMGRPYQLSYEEIKNEVDNEMIRLRFPNQKSQYTPDPCVQEKFPLIAVSPC